MNLTKDMYEYLTNFVDDRTIINMLSVNKKFNDESFFIKVTKKRYPLLVKYKEKETWKHFFLKMVYYIEKTREKFEIPYIVSKTYNPEYFYRTYGKYKLPNINVYNTIMGMAAVAGNFELVKEMIAKGADNLDFGMDEAARGGNLDIVKFFHKKGVEDLYFPIYNSIEDGNLNILKYLLKKMKYFQVNGHLQAALHLVNPGARIRAKDSATLTQKIHNNLLLEAARYGHLPIVEFLIQKGANNYTGALYRAKENGHVFTANYLRSKI